MAHTMEDAFAMPEHIHDACTKPNPYPRQPRDAEGEYRYIDGIKHMWGGNNMGRMSITNTPRAGETPEQDYQRTAEGRAAFKTQVGGDHYTSMKIQPAEYILANGIGFSEGSVIKYVSRWRSKGGVDDLKKARHHLDLLIAHEEGKK